VADFVQRGTPRQRCVFECLAGVIESSIAGCHDAVSLPISLFPIEGHVCGRLFDVRAGEKLPAFAVLRLASVRVAVFYLRTRIFMMRWIHNMRRDLATAFRFVILVPLLLLLVSCAGQQETPRDVSEIASDNTVLIFGPSVSDATEQGIKITYAQASMGFDSGCDPNRTFSEDLNECAKLPAEVKEKAISHCATYDKKAVFLGNGTNWLAQTVSRFVCE
jgi:hypothetical protein